MAQRDLSFYKRLQNLLRRPSVRSKVYAERPANRFEQRMFNVFARAASNQYMQSLAGSTERLARTRDYELMDISSSIIATALNIWADDCTTYNEDGLVLKIVSPNRRIKKELYELFYDRLEIDYHLWHWIRNMPVKYDTMIPMLSGENMTIAELAEKFEKGEELWVYAIQDKTDRIVPGKVVWCGKNYTSSTIVKVSLDDNSYVETAPEHPFILRDGTTKRADELKIGDSLMPFYRKMSASKTMTDYELVYNPESGRYSYTHRLVALQNMEATTGKLHDVIHHIDFDKHNNAPTNLRLHQEHNVSRSEKKKAFWAIPENRARASKNMVGSHMNHSVTNIEILMQNADVYCMTVVGPNGEDDRHNFALCTKYSDGTVATGGVFVKNCKYGDFFLLLDVLENEGIVSTMPLPTVEIEREEGYDGDINSVRYRWNAASAAIFDNYQVAHFRIIGDDTFLPYGKSCLESGRRTWKQLNMIEDAMLVYRIQRAPERRIFKIDVGNIAPNDIPGFIQKAKDILKRSPMVDSTGSVDLRYNVHSQEEDYFLPVRGKESGTDIASLPGANNLGDIDDVRYVQNNLIAALGIPRAYLTFEEQLQGKTTLSQEDIRFSRTIQRIQKLAISELNKLAMIHLYSLGFQDPDELTGFKLYLTNPSSVQEQMKMEFLGTKFTAYQTAVQSVGVDREWAQKNILRLTREEIQSINLGVARDSKWKAELETIAQKVAQANLPQQQPGEGGNGQQKQPTAQQQQASEPGTPPSDMVPGGDAVPAQMPTNPFTKTNVNQKSAFKNSPNSPMSGTRPSKKNVAETDEETPKVTDLFDPEDEDDREIIKIQKRYDWLGKGLSERAKVSRDIQQIFMNIDKRIQGKANENQ